MKKSTIPYTLTQLKKMFEKSGILDFDCPIQRRYGSWDEFKKSLLVHSMLVNFVVPPIYMTKENKGTKDTKGRPVSNYSCIDGQHRLRSMFDFLNDEFALHEETPRCRNRRRNIFYRWLQIFRIAGRGAAAFEFL